MHQNRKSGFGAGVSAAGIVFVESADDIIDLLGRLGDDPKAPP